MGDPCRSGARCHRSPGARRGRLDRAPVRRARGVAARSHHQLVAIHLFSNGNGRHARIAADALVTFHYGMPRLDWTRDADLDTVTPRRQAYLRAL
ncbi:Fic family protein [Aquisalimonas lutea]|uniref:Fic family protein n=1 Tax=Aquisalimonas lutea TaxID=1327750 RepID=UPI00338ED230